MLLYMYFVSQIFAFFVVKPWTNVCRVVLIYARIETGFLFIERPRNAQPSRVLYFFRKKIKKIFDIPLPMTYF